MNVIKAMKLWIKVLEDAKHHMSAMGAPIADVLDAIDQVNKVIAEAEKQEPVAWELGAEVYWNDSPALSDYIRKEGTPLYTHPQLAQPKAEQEPVGEVYLCDYCKTPFDGDWKCPSCGHTTSTKEPVYTHPQPAQPKAEGEHALERALTRLQKRYSELEAKVAAQPKRESLTYEEFKAKADEVFGFVVGLGGYEDAVRALYDIAQGEPKREPLTDEQIDEIIVDLTVGFTQQLGIARFARAIEATHGIKE